ncbi:MAG: pseudaminic acid cytidylyltransferase [Candidatus Muiribacterium halophilum]|uniref:Pseudaminic acid cytidylyltransferase n=1 Tax=Muiribacterium halophilum TaxID=2053465 RepID=A0A2N5Z9U4_MUIH1|nr:MAG: pseudaminic acid cytidylyltransferase [Candidatus Muirbacterium halophilum]
MKRIAIIPARSGSKRIPEKNIRVFIDKPILAFSIENAIKSELFDEVMVSTDSEKVAEIAKKYGSNIPFYRSPETSDDHTGLFEVLKEVINEYKKADEELEEVCLILATAPFVDEKLLKDSYDIFSKNGYDSLFPVVKFSYPIYRALEIKEEKINMIWPENLNLRSQDLPEAYHDAGLFYWIRVSEIMKKNTIFTDNSFGYEISEMVAQDIDTEEDWKIAEFKYRFLKK